MKKYQIIYADPPWAYNSKRSNYIDNSSGEIIRHYDTLTIEELKSMPIGDIIDKNCMLFLWATFPQMQEALDLIKRNNVEVCLLGVKGKPLKQVGNMSSVVISPREEHSKKPDLVREKIVELCGDVPRIELFARK